MVWSEQLTQLALGDSPQLEDQKLYCPKLEQPPPPPQKVDVFYSGRLFYLDVFF
jgi:hypothetical protein